MNSDDSSYLTTRHRDKTQSFWVQTIGYQLLPTYRPLPSFSENMVPLVVPLICAGSFALAFVHKLQSALDEEFVVGSEAKAGTSGKV
jgi:hypothetical protein